MSSYQQLRDLQNKQKTQLAKQIAQLRSASVSGVYEDRVYLQSIVGWCTIVQEQVARALGIVVIPLHSRQLHEEIATFLRYRPHPELESIGQKTVYWCNFVHEAEVHTKYKSVLKKVKPVAVQLLDNSQQHVKLAAEDPYV